MDFPCRIALRSAIVILSGGVLLCGCASPGAMRAGGGERLPFPAARRQPAIVTNVVSYTDYRDPLIGMNRAFFVFNDYTYRYALIPVSKGYRRILPDPVHRCVDNFFYNVKAPIYFVNHLLQLEPAASGRNALRFGINSTLGLLGLFDPARAWFDLERAESHLEDTFARYGAGYGLYLVLPIFGPSDLRNGTSRALEHFLNPIPWLTEDPTTTAVQSYDYFQDFAPQAERYKPLREKSEDPYLFIRNLYLQGVQRDADYPKTP